MAAITAGEAMSTLHGFSVRLLSSLTEQTVLRLSARTKLFTLSYWLLCVNAL